MLRVVDRVANRPLITENLMVIAAGHALVAEEVDVLVFDAGKFLFGLEVAQTISLVPAGGEDIEGDLAADGVAVQFSTNIHVYITYICVCKESLTSGHSLGIPS